MTTDPPVIPGRRSAPCDSTGSDAAHPAAVAALPALPPLRILVADDDALAATMMWRLLSQDGHAVRIAGSIAEALALVLAEPVDVLITDYHLPDGTGCELLRRLRERPDGCPPAAISITGFCDPEHARHIAAAGFDARLLKPITLAQLTATLARMATPTGHRSQ